MDDGLERQRLAERLGGELQIVVPVASPDRVSGRRVVPDDLARERELDVDGAGQPMAGGVGAGSARNATLARRVSARETDCASDR